MGMRETFLKHRLVWTLFFFANGLLPLVNTIEGSFARTLIHCDAPVRTEPGQLFSGSARCGDRLLVINEALALSSAAASLESGMNVLMMVVAAVLTDLYGRKPVLIVGIAFTAVSVLLFLLACLLSPWARTLFILGQGLQGAFPVELLFQQVAADLAALEGGDGMAVFELQGVVKFLPKVIFGFVASAIQVLELRSYLGLWSCVLAANLGMAALAALHLRETKRAGPSEASCGGVVAGVRRELGEYRALFAETRRVGRLELVLAYLLVDAVARARFANLIFPFSMSYYGMSAAEVIAWAIPVILIHTLSTPLVGRVCSRLGMRPGFVAVCLYKLCAAALFLLQPFSRLAWFAQYYLSSTASGWDALTSTMSSAIFKDRVSKYMALTALCSYGANAIAAPLYAAAFDAKAITYSGRLIPGLLSFALQMCGLLILFVPSTGVWPLFCIGLDEMQRNSKQQDGARLGRVPPEEKAD